MKDEAPSSDLQKIEQAHELLSGMCHGTHKFRMSSPARPGLYTDLVIGEALRIGSRAVKRLDSIDTEKLAEELRAHVAECFMGGAPPGWYELKCILDEAMGGESDEQVQGNS